MGDIRDIPPKEPGRDGPVLPDRSMKVLLAVAVTVSFVGFAVGTRSNSREEAPPASRARVDGVDVPPARAYRELRTAPLKGDITWEDSIAYLRSHEAEFPAPKVSRDLQRANRAKRRAYDGAPPTIPHPVGASDAGSCLGCHGEGVTIAGRTASVMSHGYLTQCLQCHVADVGTGISGDTLLADAFQPAGTFGTNRFAGARGPAEGPRAWRIAPPETPHRTFMRENCMSCHGERGSAPIRTSHPERQSCQQCHATPAELDQRRMN